MKEQNVLDRALAFLRSELPCSVRELRERAREAGIKQCALARAARKSGVVREGAPLKGERGKGYYLWRFPADLPSHS